MESPFHFWEADILGRCHLSITSIRSTLRMAAAVTQRLPLYFQPAFSSLLTHLSSDIHGGQTPYNSRLVMEGFPNPKENCVRAPATQHLRGDSAYSFSGISWASLWITTLLVLGVLQVQVPLKVTSPAMSHLSLPTPSPDVDPQLYLVDHHRSRLNSPLLTDVQSPVIGAPAGCQGWCGVLGVPSSSLQTGRRTSTLT